MFEQQKLQEQQYSFPYHYIPKLTSYGFSHYMFMRDGLEYISYLNFVLNLLKNIKFEKLLDVGCGDGRFIFEAQKFYPDKKIVGVDYSKQAIKLAKAMNPMGNYILGDITISDLFDDTFDVVTLIEVLEHIPVESISEFIKGIYNYNTKNGYLIITVPSINVKTNKKHFQHFSLESLKNSLNPYYQIQDHYFINSNSFVSRILKTIMVNRFIILKQRHILTWIYKFYISFFFQSNKKNSKRICAVFKKL